ncbi:Vacuolar protein sorting protein 25, partial [Zea mays]
AWHRARVSPTRRLRRLHPPSSTADRSSSRCARSRRRPLQLLHAFPAAVAPARRSSAAAPACPRVLPSTALASARVPGRRRACTPSVTNRHLLRPVLQAAASSATSVSPSCATTSLERSAYSRSPPPRRPPQQFLLRSARPISSSSAVPVDPPSTSSSVAGGGAPPPLPRSISSGSALLHRPPVRPPDPAIRLPRRPEICVYSTCIGGFIF